MQLKSLPAGLIEKSYRFESYQGNTIPSELNGLVQCKFFATGSSVNGHLFPDTKPEPLYHTVRILSP